jgi:N-acetylmuramidase-like protein
MLTDEDYKEAARELGCEIAAIKAVAHVEAPKGPFLPDGRLTILFEAHIFHKYTQGKFTPTHPHISSAKWDRKLYKGGAGEWPRMEEAFTLDPVAAQMSASYGAFQIMGFNFAACGFKTVEAFVESMLTEPGQLAAFVEFIKSKDLDDELHRKDWSGFARIYNGPGYVINDYHTKMAKAYEKFSK